jgi:xanthine dehydrogenase accessory factor
MDHWGEGWAVLERAGELKRQGEAFALATVVWRQGPSSGKQGCRAIITASGELHGWIGGACAEPAVIREAKEVISDGEPRLLLLGTSEQFGAAVPDGIAVVPISCQSEGALEVYIEPVLPAPHLVVVGRSPMVNTLLALAEAVGWRTDRVDSPEFSPRFSLACANARSMVIVATQGHGDEDGIEEAVAARPAYIGLVASSKRGQAVLGYLAERGVARDQLDRVIVPAGLDLGPTSHREMAVAILADLVRFRASGELAVVDAPAARETAEVADAIDPVCGMTVTPSDAGYQYQHDGATYYFCCPGCRRSFEKDPAVYVKEDAPC